MKPMYDKWKRRWGVRVGHQPEDFCLQIEAIDQDNSTNSSRWHLVLVVQRNHLEILWMVDHFGPPFSGVGPTGTCD